VSDSRLKAKAKLYGSQEEILCSSSNLIFFILSREISLLGENYLNTPYPGLYCNQQYCNDSGQENNVIADSSLGLHVL